MSRDEIQEISFQMVLHAGNARSLFIESLRLLISGNDNAEAKKKYDEGAAELVEAHKQESLFMAKYGNHEEVEMDIFLVHANDHLSMATTMQELCCELKPLIETVNSIKDKVEAAN